MRCVDDCQYPGALESQPDDNILAGHASDTNLLAGWLCGLE